MHNLYYNFERRHSVHPACNSRKKRKCQISHEVVKEIPSFHGKLNCVIDRISVERIKENGESIIEFEVLFLKADKSQLFIS